MRPEYIAIIIIFIALLIQQRNEAAWLKTHIAKKKEDNTEMVELAKRFIGKECIISAFNNQHTGIIREVSKSAILLEGKDGPEAVNLDFVAASGNTLARKTAKRKALLPIKQHGIAKVAMPCFLTQFCNILPVSWLLK